MNETKACVWGPIPWDSPPPPSRVFLLIILCDLKISKQMMVFKADYLCIDPQTYGLELQVCQAQV